VAGSEVKILQRARESGRGLPQSKTLARNITPATLVGVAGEKIYSLN
jgi:hypothetical protein